MHISTRVLVAVLVLLAAPLAAQVVVGKAVPAQPLPLPLDSAQLALHGDSAPAAAVIAFHDGLAAAAGDSDLLRALLRQHGGQGLRAVAVVTGGVPEPCEALRGVQVAMDPGGSVRAAWLGGQHEFHVVVVAGGTVVWAGRPEYGLAAVVAQALAGKLDVQQSAVIQFRRQVLIDGFDDASGEAAQRDAQWLLDRCPTDGLAWGLRCVAETEKRLDAAAAQATVAAAVAALSGDPRALAAFADLALRGAADRRPRAERLREGLLAAAVDWPRDLQVQLACLRALVASGHNREVGKMAQLLRKAVADDGPAALALVDILTQDQPAMAHRDLCAQVLAGAERAGADGRLLAAARYAVALRCGEDPAAAKEIAAAYLDQHRSRIETNNDAWSLMTALGTRGRFDSFALALVERMLEQEAVMEDFEFDTAALAMFLNGKVERAVELQQRAVDKGGVDNPEYGERLQRYRGAQPPR